MNNSRCERIAVPLRGVPETLLWPLYNRAYWARRRGAQLHDPKAIEVYESIDYPFAQHFGRPNEAHALRALRFDDEVLRFLRKHPEGSVVALGEGLETGFWRVDNGRMRWLSVDLPEAIAFRARWLPDTDRHTNIACSALDFRWMDAVDVSRGVFVMAEGLLMYFEPAEVERLLAACAERFPGSEMMFDTIPRWLSQRTLRGWRLTKDYVTPRMPWGIDADELNELKQIHPNITSVREVRMGRGQGFLFGVLIPLLGLLPMPRGIAGKHPAFVVVQFGDTASVTQSRSVATSPESDASH
jgi:O-methyltransferase involved in polyketide biosynthesis